MANAKTLNFKPKEITKKLLAEVPERARDVLTKRYGLGKSGVKMTLEAIGEEYGITRERVRQIENFALNLVKKSKAFKASEPVFVSLKRQMEEEGGIVHEQDFISSLAKDRESQNSIHFLLVVSDAFVKLKEDEEFHHRWTTDLDLAEKVHVSLRNLCSNFSEQDLISEPELVTRFLRELKEAVKDPRVEDFSKKWLKICKNISQNPMGEWGLASSPNVKMRGIRDYAYLVLRQKGTPMHFTEVSKAIAKTFGKKAHPATCHNELIKDDRFVLVGRGLYALAEWGYPKGTVVEVIRDILEKTGPLTKDEIIKKVLEKRYVKENTISVNLQNPKYFKKEPGGKYGLLKEKEALAS